MHSLHAIVKPCGTGTPRFVISARFAPLPPSTLLISRVPSASPFPKKKTDCGIRSAAASEPKLLRIGRRRGRVVSGEAGVTETIRPFRHGLEHAIDGQIAERIDAECGGYLIDVHVGG